MPPQKGTAMNIKKKTASVLLTALILTVVLSISVFADTPVYDAHYDMESDATSAYNVAANSLNKEAAYGDARTNGTYWITGGSTSTLLVASETGNNYLAARGLAASCDLAIYPDAIYTDTANNLIGKTFIVSMDIRVPSASALENYMEIFTGRCQGSAGIFFYSIRLTKDCVIVDETNQSSVYHTLVPGEWTNIAVAYNMADTTYRLFIDGVEKTTAPVLCKTSGEVINVERIKMFVTKGVSTFDADNIALYVSDVPRADVLDSPATDTTTAAPVTTAAQTTADTAAPANTSSPESAATTDEAAPGTTAPDTAVAGGCGGMISPLLLTAIPACAVAATRKSRRKQ